MTKTQEELFKLLTEFNNICLEHNIEYILAGGCALGAVRNGGFLPWDDDVDILIKRSEYEKLDRILSSEIRSDRAWITEENTPDYKNPVARYYDLETTLIYGTMVCLDIPQSHHLEIFIMDPFPSNPEDQLKFKQMLWLYTELRQPYFISANYGLPVEVTDKKLFDEYSIRIQNEGLSTVIKEIKNEFTKYSEEDCHLWCGRWSHSHFVFEDSWVGETQNILFEGKPFPVGKGIFHHMRENYDSNWDMVPTRSKQVTHYSIDNTEKPYSDHKEEYLKIIDENSYRNHYIERKKINLTRFFETLEWQRDAALLRNAFLSKLADNLNSEAMVYSTDNKDAAAAKLGEFLHFQFLPSYIKFKMSVDISNELYEMILYYLIDENRYEDAVTFNEMYINKDKYEYFKTVLNDIGELKLTRYYKDKSTARKIINDLSSDAILNTQIEIERARAWLLSQETGILKKGKTIKAFELFLHEDDPEIKKYLGDFYYRIRRYDLAEECFKYFNDNSRNGMLKREIKDLEKGGRK